MTNKLMAGMNLKGNKGNMAFERTSVFQVVQGKNINFMIVELRHIVMFCTRVTVYVYVINK